MPEPIESHEGMTKGRFWHLLNTTQWFNSFEKLKAFIDENQRRPRLRSLNEEEKSLARWYAMNLRSFELRKGAMKHEEIYSAFAHFLS